MSNVSAIKPHQKRRHVYREFKASIVPDCMEPETSVPELTWRPPSTPNRTSTSGTKSMLLKAAAPAIAVTAILPSAWKGERREVPIQSPRDQEGSFDPQFVRNGQSRMTQMDDPILALYAKDLSTQDTEDAFTEMYDGDISAILVS